MVEWVKRSVADMRSWVESHISWGIVVCSCHPSSGRQRQAPTWGSLAKIHKVAGFWGMISNEMDHRPPHSTYTCTHRNTYMCMLKESKAWGMIDREVEGSPGTLVLVGRRKKMSLKREEETSLVNYHWEEERAKEEEVVINLQGWSPWQARLYHRSES